MVFHFIFVTLQKTSMMEYKAVKYRNREEALAAFIRMRDKKREWIKKTETELKQMREEAE